MIWYPQNDPHGESQDDSAHEIGWVRCRKIGAHRSVGIFGGIHCNYGDRSGITQTILHDIDFRDDPKDDSKDDVEADSREESHWNNPSFMISHTHTKHAISCKTWDSVLAVLLHPHHLRCC